MTSVSAAPAFAAGPVIAVVAPVEGALSILGEQVRDGARRAAGDRAVLVEIPETCEDDSGKDLAAAIRAAKPVAAIGFLCSQSLEGAMPGLAEGKIPAITLSVRSGVLMEDALKNGWPFFRLAPTAAEERSKIVETIFNDWKDAPFALLDDGTILSRETIEAVREALEEQGMKAAFIDNFRPAQEVQSQLIRRLAKAGVTHAFVAGDRNDMSVIARDAKAQKRDLVLLGGDAIDGPDQPVPLEKGVYAVTLPYFATLPESDGATSEGANERTLPEGYVLPAQAATRVVIEAQEIAAGSGAPLADALVDTPFNTAMGEIRFTERHELARNPFALLQWNGTAFVPPSQ